MSNSLSPWILDFLLNIAKEFGAKLFDVQPYTKKKKVQIIEFLTYPPKEQNTFIWARISDKKHIATVKFTKKAVETCQARSASMPRLTQHKGAIATLSKFKPTCSRFPLEQDRMSSEAFIIFECDYVEILGSSGESTFGQPKGIEQDPEISLWSKGVAQGGGAGNVLKERQLEMEGKSLNNVKPLPPMPSLSPIPNFQPPPPPKADTNVVLQPAFKRIEDLNRETYKARWHFLEKDRLDFIGPSIDVIEAEEKGHESEMQNTDLEERSRSGTPISNWENSPRAKARSESPDEKRQEQEEDSELRKIVSVSSSLPAPTPAQRGSLATPNVVNETQIGPGTRHLPMARKVPRPASPEPPAAEQIGPARVLAPNSDTSQSQSQKTPLLGGNVVDTTGQLPWMSMGDVGRVMRLTAELRLRNHSSVKC